MFCKKGALRNFAKFPGNTCARVSFLRQLKASASVFYRTSQVAASELSFEEWLIMAASFSNYVILSCAQCKGMWKTIQTSLTCV